jgi:uncharacterized protein YjiS (DUF1127 family)
MQEQPLVDSLRRIVTTLALWIARAGERRQLVELEHHLLKDIGITRYGAYIEARRAPWEGEERVDRARLRPQTVAAAEAKAASV